MIYKLTTKYLTNFFLFSAKWGKITLKAKGYLNKKALLLRT
ncbi:hypothetical protein QSH14_12345 [Proteus faecis]|uniref:Uncharacterized protein n=1 Tax=Proteus faecis TaxID=2050967 RepID=A0AAW7CV72_9GAMM|nr:hypothetical protein [Proteus faecis]MDO5404309.1 hypothetical protein [Proteus sp. (in: enterobacteria)]MDL5168057.1 hypothetical protein [Proteus faecis]MDL5276042.1 hypothetical protein [Proteus faecis]MDL5279609.1 hypothetical protein [Proteus faecis]MDL5308578.1 hypothetical protein [Proteus faecis]